MQCVVPPNMPHKAARSFLAAVNFGLSGSAGSASFTSKMSVRVMLHFIQSKMLQMMSSM